MKSKSLVKSYIPLPDSFLAEHATKKATENEIKRLETIENEKRFVVPKDDEEYASYLWEQLERNAEDELTVDDLTFALENLYMSIPSQKRLEKLIQDKQPTEKQPYEMSFEEWKGKFYSNRIVDVKKHKKGLLLNFHNSKLDIEESHFFDEKEYDKQKISRNSFRLDDSNYLLEILYNRQKRNHHLRALKALRFGEPTSTSDKFRLVPTENGYKAVRGLGYIDTDGYHQNTKKYKKRLEELKKNKKDTEIFESDLNFFKTNLQKLRF